MSTGPCATCGHRYAAHYAYSAGGCDHHDGTHGVCPCPKYVEPRPSLKCAKCGHSYENHGTPESMACEVLHGAPLARCDCQGFKFPETPKPVTISIDPTCLNCKHPWSSHFVNDPDSRCSLKITAGKETWCSCGAFRGGCAKCNHSMDEHGSFGRLGMCQHKDWSAVAQPNVGANRCTCDGYEPMRRELPAPITEGAR